MSHFEGAIEDSLCVGQKMADQEERVLLFVQMRPDTQLTEQIIAQIRQTIATGLSPRHLPKEIIAVPKIPYNVNGKKLEVLVKRILSGGSLDARTKGTLAEEGSLDYFVRFAKRQHLDSRELRSKL